MAIISQFYDTVRSWKISRQVTASSFWWTRANCRNVQLELIPKAGRNVNLTRLFITQIRSARWEIPAGHRDRPRFKLDPLPLTRLQTIYRFGLRRRRLSRRRFSTLTSVRFLSFPTSPRVSHSGKMCHNAGILGVL